MVMATLIDVCVLVGGTLLMAAPFILWFAGVV